MILYHGKDNFDCRCKINKSYDFNRTKDNKVGGKKQRTFNLKNLVCLHANFEVTKCVDSISHTSTALAGSAICERASSFHYNLHT